MMMGIVDDWELFTGFGAVSTRFVAKATSHGDGGIMWLD